MQETRLVLDTNVVVSAQLKSTGFERFIFGLALDSKVRLCISREIMDEYEAVLMRPKFGFPPKLLHETFRRIEEAAIWVVPSETIHAASDPDDNKFLECAEAARAIYLVTGNGRHFPQRWKSTKILNARELTTILVPEL
ncbi:MAG: putative toxin-antitoxin system toxin component, PIN family [Acidobacteriaceae bacterium]